MIAKSHSLEPWHCKDIGNCDSWKLGTKCWRTFDKQASGTSCPKGGYGYPVAKAGSIG